jgi:hypothetical protein
MGYAAQDVIWQNETRTLKWGVVPVRIGAQLRSFQWNNMQLMAGA